ncbi:hypothetical protein M433DRAFT_8871 [Acidomyces richmondensis BFW]|nr:hypothetical protein M433DRAFT_8871 [Acidomyces richmondensis BFW]
MRRPAQITRSEFRNFKRSAMRVVDDARGREEILARLYDESGYRSYEGTYRKVADRYF